MALSIADHGYVMETGRVVLDKPAAALLKDDDVREFYLGLHPGEDGRRSFKDATQYRRKKRWSAGATRSRGSRTSTSPSPG